MLNLMRMSGLKSRQLSTWSGRKQQEDRTQGSSKEQEDDQNREQEDTMLWGTQLEQEDWESYVDSVPEGRTQEQEHEEYNKVPSKEQEDKTEEEQEDTILWGTQGEQEDWESYVWSNNSINSQVNTITTAPPPPPPPSSCTTLKEDDLRCMEDDSLEKEDDWKMKTLVPDTLPTDKLEEGVRGECQDYPDSPPTVLRETPVTLLEDVLEEDLSPGATGNSLRREPGAVDLQWSTVNTVGLGPTYQSDCASIPGPSMVGDKQDARLTVRDCKDVKETVRGVGLTPTGASTGVRKTGNVKESSLTGWLTPAPSVGQTQNYADKQKSLITNNQAIIADPGRCVEMLCDKKDALIHLRTPLPASSDESDDTSQESEDDPSTIQVSSVRRAGSQPVYVSDESDEQTDELVTNGETDRLTRRVEKLAIEQRDVKNTEERPRVQGCSYYRGGCAEYMVRVQGGLGGRF